ncbi:50S ribosomal protein L25/general stress protein Ctc [Nostocoides jenkinsii]|uniref:Large ribosomal subunit protein bL25 n=1 Tax=Nostocoides jenkinsii Ben 74 TaxID=1193518 RepID=A0A077M8L0_9MICO|nr:50S ribosomal protein L25/general stress protein Ctc [Tetrasphaera jenkinsii]CCI53676.1 50S ribosomal protein L25 [Tetrasphaera jenkinsii Ben 74]
MSNHNHLTVELRTEFGKGAARRVRRAGKVPAVLYGHGTQPVHITMPGHDAMMALKHANALLTLDIDGKEQLALAKDVQRNPIKPIIEHVDLVIVRKGEKVTVDVAVHTEGEAGPETVVTVESATVQVECEATHIPESIVVDIEGATAGTQIHASALALPEGVTLVTDGETLVVNVAAMISQEVLDAELADAESEAGIEHEEPVGEETAEAAAATDEAGGAE